MNSEDLSVGISFYDRNGNIKRGFVTMPLELTLETVMEMAEFLNGQRGNHIVIVSGRKEELTNGL